MKILKRVGDYRLLKYSNDFYAVDYSNESVGYTVFTSEDRTEVEQKFSSVTASK